MSQYHNFGQALQWNILYLLLLEPLISGSPLFLLDGLLEDQRLSQHNSRQNFSLILLKKCYLNQQLCIKSNKIH
ncbi:unnamed protein product [Paramecium sonneborni]|uniref:Uncharacterized protein n=1 Tax=Paramecium sonneborni TaxID=65129 RepID=A0A8S1PJM0_9CILI|nr:unnamed protein product [Paramecium sonneborni]